MPSKKPQIELTLEDEEILDEVWDEIEVHGFDPEPDEPSLNVFCPTGPGGGVNPTCSPKSKKKSSKSGTPVQSEHKQKLDELKKKLEKTKSQLDSLAKPKPKSQSKVYTVDPAPELNEHSLKTISRLSESVDFSPNLTDESKIRYKEAIDRVARRMPPKAHELLQDGLKDAKFYNTQEDANNGFFEAAWARAEAREPGWKRFLRRVSGITKLEKQETKTAFLNKGLAIAMYDNKENTTHMNGGGPNHPLHHVYAHELAHAIDKNHRLSNTDSWKNAFESDIDLPSTPLSSYAKTNRSEGFAEFARAVYSGDVPLKDIEASFPRASTVFKENGLWPS